MTAAAPRPAAHFRIAVFIGVRGEASAVPERDVDFELPILWRVCGLCACVCFREIVAVCVCFAAECVWMPRCRRPPLADPTQVRACVRVFVSSTNAPYWGAAGPGNLPYPTSLIYYFFILKP